MATGGLLCVEALGGVLRADVAFERHKERISLAEERDVIDAKPPRMVWMSVSLPSLRAPSSRRFCRSAGGSLASSA